MTEKIFSVDLYSDGACSGNPGPGGYAYILSCNGKIKKKSAGYICTTNNRMELMGVIEGLKCLKKKCNVKIYSDSQYIVKAFNESWLEKWKKNFWKKKGSKSEQIKNIDLWKELDKLVNKHNTEFIWVKGHSNNPINNECDKLAVEASLSSNKIQDKRFIEQTKIISDYSDILF